MIEGFCDFLTEEQVLEAIETGHKAIHDICHHLDAWREKIGKPKKRDTLRKIPHEVNNAVHASAAALLESALRISAKQEREKALAEIKETVLKTLLPEGRTPKHSKVDVLLAYKNLQSSLMRKMILDEKKTDRRPRPQRHPPDRHRAIDSCPAPTAAPSSPAAKRNRSPSVPSAEKPRLSALKTSTAKGLQRFYLQYFFPPFSVGEVGRMGAPGRREIGHGKLAERALAAILPKQEDFPYVIRLESNITESNGSSSMASVCGGCLAMMDAGVPIKRPVAGIAMGLILEGDKYAILSDILGAEDALGDMDFKVTGDDHGITAFQMDIKVEGITHEIMQAALAQAKEGRTHILHKMLAVCPESKEEMSAYAPRIETIQIKPSKIGIVIGPGGKQIRAIIEETGVQIDINDSGLVSIASNNAEAMERAKADHPQPHRRSRKSARSTTDGSPRSFRLDTLSKSSAKKGFATSPKFRNKRIAKHPRYSVPRRRS